MSYLQSADKQGGAAFPRHETESSHGETGMSLRDWFAGQALAGICANNIPGAHHMTENMVRDAYACADAMLRIRNASK